MSDNTEPWEPISIKRAFFSLTDKTGAAEFAAFLHNRDVEILASGGTGKYLRGLGTPAIDVSSYTEAPPILSDRVKTIHPRIAGGILSLRDNEVHLQEMEEHGIKPIDLVVVSFYDIEDAIAKKLPAEEMVEVIDVGGPGSAAAAAKNYKYVCALTDPSDYGKAMDMIGKYGSLILPFRREMAKKALLKISAFYAAGAVAL